jgi:hypothetical protein
VVEPDLARSRGARGSEMLARREVLAVGSPRRAVHQAEGLLGDLPGPAPVALDHPDIVAAGAIARERDALAVRAEAGLFVPGHALRQDPGLASGEGQQVEVAEQVEHDLATIRADVHRHPGAGPDVERNLSLGARSGVHLPRPVLRHARGRPSRCGAHRPGLAFAPLGLAGFVCPGGRWEQEQAGARDRNRPREGASEHGGPREE